VTNILRTGPVRRDAEWPRENTGWVAQASTWWAPFPQQLAPLGESCRGVRCMSSIKIAVCRHITDHGQALGHVVTERSFVDDRQWRIVHALGEGPGLWRRTTTIRGTPHLNRRSRAER